MLLRGRETGGEAGGGNLLPPLLAKGSRNFSGRRGWQRIVIRRVAGIVLEAGWMGTVRLSEMHEYCRSVAHLASGKRGL
jgi:hypothetical protein